MSCWCKGQKVEAVCEVSRTAPTAEEQLTEDKAPTMMLDMEQWGRGNDKAGVRGGKTGCSRAAEMLLAAPGQLLLKLLLFSGPRLGIQIATGRQGPAQGG